MRFIKLAAISVIVLFIVATCIGLLLPSKVLVSRAIDITAPRDSIFANVKDMNRWIKWIQGMDNPRVHVFSATEADLAGMKVVITDTSKYSVHSFWQGKKTTIQYSTFQLIESTNTVIAQWQFEQKLKWYPWERLGSFMNDKIIGTMMEKNLDNLKKLCEQK